MAWARHPFIRLTILATVAAVGFGVADLVFSWNPLAADPYLENRSLPVFRSEPFLALGFVAEIVNGWIAAVAFTLVERGLAGSPLRRGLIFGGILWGFWVVSGTFTAMVWLALPTTLAITNVAFGLGKCLCIGSVIAWTWSRWPVRESQTEQPVRAAYQGRRGS